MQRYVYVSPEPYSTDILAMLRSYYPERNLKVLVPESRPELLAQAKREGYFCSVVCEAGAARILLEGEELAAPAEKSQLGAFFYRLLRERTGRELPWGNLNGVRPTKPAFFGLLKGETPEEIARYYRGEHFVTEEKTRLAIEIAGREAAVLQGLPADVSDGLYGAARGFSLYIGIPFCPSTCLYCSFPSYPVAAHREKLGRYLDCVIREMDAVAGLMRGRELASIYIGGGTPTTLEPGQLRRLLSALWERFPVSMAREFTVEAGRADSITEEKLRALKESGVSRISINPQTMNQATLDFIGRRASVGQTLDAYALARSLGFDNINMDLILGLPGEGTEEVRHTMREVSRLAPDSLTVHSLAIKRASRFARWVEENGVPAAEDTAEMMRIAAEGAERMGLLPYYLYRQKNIAGNLENIGFAREGAFGFYNIVMMEEVQSIAALGAGTISKRVDWGTDGEGNPAPAIRRAENPKDVMDYVNRIEEMIERKRALFADPVISSPAGSLEDRKLQRKEQGDRAAMYV